MPWTYESRRRAANKRRATGKRWYSGPRIMGTRNAHEREVWQKNKRGEPLSLDEEIVLEGIKHRREEERFNKKMRKGILAEWRARREASLAGSSENKTTLPLPMSTPPPPPPPVFPPFPSRPFEGSKVSDLDEMDAFAEWDAVIQQASGQALTPEAKAADRELTR
jgi:hypothetical protein